MFDYSIRAKEKYKRKIDIVNFNKKLENIFSGILILEPNNMKLKVAQNSKLQIYFFLFGLSVVCFWSISAGYSKWTFALLIAPVYFLIAWILENIMAKRFEIICIPDQCILYKIEGVNEYWLLTKSKIYCFEITGSHLIKNIKLSQWGKKLDITGEFDNRVSELLKDRFKIIGLEDSKKVEDEMSWMFSK